MKAMQLVHRHVQTCALLTDLFASPSYSESPNIRAAVCHGYYDQAILELEVLALLADWASNRKQIVPTEVDKNGLKDAAFAVISVFDLTSSNLSGQPRMAEYKPPFTYTSMATRDLDGILCNLTSLSLLMENNEVLDCIDKMRQQHQNTFAYMSSMSVDLGKVNYSLALAHNKIPLLPSGHTRL